jgi:hypothetical protein
MRILLSLLIRVCVGVAAETEELLITGAYRLSGVSTRPAAWGGNWGMGPAVEWSVATDPV